MEAFDKAYRKVQKFVDDFANSSTDTVSVPKKIENKTAWYAEWDDNYLGSFLLCHFWIYCSVEISKFCFLFVLNYWGCFRIFNF